MVKLEYRPVAQPHMGGHIERLLGTLMGALHELPGATFSSPKQRGNYDSDARAGRDGATRSRTLAPLDAFERGIEQITSSLLDGCGYVSPRERRRSSALTAT
jgi:hypothetical protein